MIMSNRQILEYFETDKLDFAKRGVPGQSCVQVAGASWRDRDKIGLGIMTSPALFLLTCSTPSYYLSLHTHSFFVSLSLSRTSHHFLSLTLHLSSSLSHHITGDVMIIPESWGHGVLNLQESVAVATEAKANIWRSRPPTLILGRLPNDNRSVDPIILCCIMWK
jgi:hypothetical protein